MLITEQLRAALTVDWSDGEHPAAAEAAAREVAKHIIAIADERAWKVREESVHVRRVDGRPHGWMSTFEGVWSPRTVVFVGGEYDGDERQVRREDDGLPLPLLQLPYRSSPYVGEAVPHVDAHPAYERAGIDPIRDVWVYRLVK